MPTDLMKQLGETKAEKLLNGFVMTDKNTGKEIISRYGADAFTMWWYVTSLCFGKDTVVAFPKKETIAEDLGISVSTVQRWIRKLEKIKAIKRVPIFNQHGSQTSNLLITNTSFPEIPDGWDELYQFGAYKIRHKEYIPLKSSEDRPWSIMNTLVKQLKESQEEQEPQENSPGQICTGHKYTLIKSEQGGWSNLNRGGKPSNPSIPRDEGPFSEGEEEEVEKESLYTYKPIGETGNVSSGDRVNTGFRFYNWLNQESLG